MTPPPSPVAPPPTASLLSTLADFFPVNPPPILLTSEPEHKLSPWEKDPFALLQYEGIFNTSGCGSTPSNQRCALQSYWKKRTPLCSKTPGLQEPETRPSPNRPPSQPSASADVTKLPKTSSQLRRPVAVATSALICAGAWAEASWGSLRQHDSLRQTVNQAAAAERSGLRIPGYSRRDDARDAGAGGQRNPPPRYSSQCVGLRMQCTGQNQGQNSAVLLLHSLAWVWTGAIESSPKLNMHPHAAVTLQENTTHRFNCQSQGWDPQAPPLLTWYLNGERQTQPSHSGKGQLVVTSPEESRVLEGGSKHNSTFTLRARKWDRELVCAATNSQSGESYNATVILNVQFLPEIIRVNAHYSDTSDPGLSLVLFALVRSNPPATITWVDQSGRLVTLSSLSGNISVNASNSVGSAQTNLTLAEFLQSSVEVPVLGILTGGAMGFITLLILTLLLLCLIQKNKGKNIEEPVEITIPKSDSLHRQVDSTYLPRENMSVPWNLQLNDLGHLCKGQGERRQNPGGEKIKEGEEEEEDLSAAYAARGFSRYPMVGYIYKVNSMSSDEIWL
ncbi:hypothetical protein AGOR_G00121980 [Albula goreensis]|uniref:Ig-like domain-containing protein n=1 Tax=Albula goreensis TaxID=1534307 RepID=A0A8T3DAR9_9TELE|nr:hypothetical protein AGOR_G00121980 [Albula goreensis]